MSGWQEFISRTQEEYDAWISGESREAPNLAAAMENFCSCIAKVNSPEHYRDFSESGLSTYVRTEESTIEDALLRLRNILDC